MVAAMSMHDEPHIEPEAGFADDLDDELDRAFNQIAGPEHVEPSNEDLAPWGDTEVVLVPDGFVTT
jgi:hypothetical protein